MMTYEEYMDRLPPFKDREASRAHHRAFYSQFVTPEIVALVGRALGDRLLTSPNKDECFNDIPLAAFDTVGAQLPPSAIKAMRDAGYVHAGSLSNRCCIVKEACKQWLEQERAK